MKIVKLFLCFLLVTGAWLAVKPTSASACSCAAPAPVQEDLQRKTAIFSGKVRSISTPGLGLLHSTADPVKVTFEVQDVWKGELHSKTVVYTALSSASCGYEDFAVNQEFIVFAHGNPDRLETGICERTKPLASAGEELAALGSGYKPAGTWQDDGIFGPHRYATGALVVLIVAVAAAFVFAGMRRRSGKK